MSPTRRPSTSTRPVHSLTRRRALQLGAGAAAAGACAAAPSGVLAAGVQSPALARHSLPLLEHWRFWRADVTGAERPDFNDRAWPQVSLPHGMPYAWPGEAAEVEGQYYRGPGWYRLRLPALPHAPSGASWFLHFDGAATVADVYCNGQHLGTHRGAFAAFCFDASAAWRPHGENLIAVRVDNTWSADIPPIAGDFNVFGGLYREAHLLCLPAVSISPLDFASPGIYAIQQKVSRESARLELRAVLRNASARAAVCELHWQILDHAGQVVAAKQLPARLPAHGHQEFSAPLSLAHPHLWHGRRDPYLYRLVASLRRQGRVIDTVTQPLGLRFFHATSDRGFFLNGEPYPLHGVNVHQDRPVVGRAVPYPEIAQDFTPILELGATSVRLPHYQHAPTAYDACDRNGLVLWTEFGLVNRITHTPAFTASARQQLTELIRQNQNHPSVFFWSLFNELAFHEYPIRSAARAKALIGKRSTASGPVPWELVFNLNQLAHKLDSTRPTVAATDQAALHPMNFIPDLISYNRYYGWYRGTPEDWPKGLDGIHDAVEAVRPGRVIGMSEYGAGANPFQHQYPVTQPAPGGPFHPEEWQCIVHEHAWAAMRARPWLYNTQLWCMYDFASAGRHEGGVRGLNDKGLVSYDRRIRKDAFYFYQAQWSARPLVHICGRRFNPRPAGVAGFKVYSNCARVELFLNGKSLGTRSGRDHVFRWPQVVLAAGPLHLRAVARLRGGRELRDEYAVEVH